MRYEVGDRVRIKMWEDMIANPFDGQLCFIKEMEISLNTNFPDRILTIGYVEGYGPWYFMDGIGGLWQDYMIKESVNDCCDAESEIFDSIEDRWEILDLSPIEK